MTKINKEKETLLPVALLKELLRYEYETGLFYWLNTGSGRKFGHVAGSIKGTGYVEITINGYIYLAHRLAWLYVHGEFPQGGKPHIDHINGKRADNRIANLRISNTVENGRNMQRMSNNTSGVTGVYREEKKKPSGKIYIYWRALWRDENGKKRIKGFPVHKLGEEIAKQMAIEYRAEQLRLLELTHGITYSARHGL